MELEQVKRVVGVFNCQGAGAWPLKEGGQEKPIAAPIRLPILGHVRPLDVELFEDIASDNWEGDSAVYAFHTGQCLSPRVCTASEISLLLE